MDPETSPFEFLKKYRVVPVITVPDAESVYPLADALRDGGLPLVEITFRTPAAAEAIFCIRRHAPEMCVGAGTLLNEKNLEDARLSGAAFGVAPGTNPVMVELCDEYGFPFIPGVCTPSEVETAVFMGCRVLKFFPAEAAGGVNMLDAIYAPYASTGVKFIPTGGVSAKNLADYLKNPAVLACGGTWLATKEEIAEGKWAQISEKCRRAREIVASVTD